jgi:hypothetical protein
MVLLCHHFLFIERQGVRMAWRPNQFVIDGVLKNTVSGKVTGWIQFKGLSEKVTFDLDGNFHRDIRGASIHFKGDSTEDAPDAEKYMEGFALHQTGKVGDMTAGLPPYDYVRDQVYIEWYSDQNGRVVIELEQDQVKIIGTTIPACESDPISREQQNHNMTQFLSQLAQDCSIPQENVLCVGVTSQATSNHRGHQLLPDEIRKQLPALYSQDGKGGKAIVYAKFFTPDSNWTWLATYVELGISAVMWSSGLCRVKW